MQSKKRVKEETNKKSIYRSWSDKTYKRADGEDF